METDFAAIRDAVSAAQLSAENRHTLTWSIDQLPALYRQYCDTYESRFGDAIRRLVQGALKVLTEAGAPDVAELLLTRLQALHERLGLQTLGLRPSPATSRRPGKRKAG